MKRFFVEDIEEGAQEARITGTEFAHLKKVLRLTAGSRVSLFNGRGLELQGAVDTIGRDFAMVRIEGRVEARPESPVEVMLLQALLKGDRPEFIIQKAAELGASEVCFYTTARTVPGAPATAREARWKKVAIAAAKQCGRAVLTRVSVATGLDGALAKAGGRGAFLKLALWEGVSKAGRMKDALQAADKVKGVAVLVGPEGGLSEQDVKEAEKAGFSLVGIGPRILRAETAAVAALATVQYELGDLG